MGEKRKLVDDEKITGFFDSNTVMKGELSFRGSFRIDGYFEGKISSEAILIIGDQGKVKADIEVGTCIIRGEVQGTLRAKEKIEVHDKGRVIGTLMTPRLAVEEGAFLEARCLAGEGANFMAESLKGEEIKS